MKKIVLFTLAYMICGLGNFGSLEKSKEKIIRKYAESYEVFNQVRNYTCQFSSDKKVISFTIDKENYELDLNYNYLEFNNGIYNYYLGDCFREKLLQKDLDVIQVEIKDMQYYDDYILSVYFSIHNYDRIFKIQENITSYDFGFFTILENYTEEEKFEAINTTDIISSYRQDLSELPVYDCTKKESSTQKIAISSNITNFDKLAGSLAMYDSLLDIYDPLGGTSLTSSGQYRDDYIVRMIPKEAFFNFGIYLFIGKEFGYSVVTTLESNTVYTSDVFMFDIETKHLGYDGTDIDDNVNNHTVTIIPKFQMKYGGYTKDSIFGFMFDPKYDEVVLPQEEINNYGLKDIRSTLVNENRDHPNIGDEDYVSTLDYGEYIVSTETKINGCTLSRDIDYNSIGKLTLRNIIGYIPYVDSILSAIEYGKDLFTEIFGSDYQKQEVNSKNMINDNRTIKITQSFQGYAEDQIRKYGHLVKSAYFEGLENTVPDLVVSTKEKDDFFKFTATFNRYDQSICYNQNLYSGIEAKFVRKVSNSSSLHVLGETSMMTYVENYLGVAIDVTANSETNVNISIPGQKVDFRFVAPKNGFYVFTTVGNEDTYIEMYSASGVLMYDNDDDIDNNARVADEIKKGEMRYLRVWILPSTTTGSFIFKVC